MYGFIDKLDSNKLYLAKSDGEYYYVPQTLPVSSRAAYGDFDGDGLMDVASFDGAFISVTFQAGQGAADPIIVEPDPIVVNPAPVTEPVPASDVPAIDANATKVETAAAIEQVRGNNVLLTSGKTLWFNAESIIKYNDASGFEVGQRLEFKASQNPDGSLIGIKIEVVE